MNLRGLLHSLQQHLGRGGAYPHQFAFALLLPLRRLFISPEQLADRLGLGVDSAVLELGPGPGYFSAEIARRIPQGRLLLVDIQREMLLKARRRLTQVKATHTAYVQANATDLPLRDGTFDTALLVTVLGEVPDPRACLHELWRVLRPQGLLSITEQPIDPDFLPLAEVRAMAEGAGFCFERVFGGGRNYTVNLRKRGPRAPGMQGYLGGAVRQPTAMQATDGYIYRPDRAIIELGWRAILRCLALCGDSLLPPSRIAAPEILWGDRRNRCAPYASGWRGMYV